MSTGWNVDAYRNEHETEDHWELKKKFMLAHKDKFPEDELVCLAQVFTNIEFMGCRYPDQTMIRVAKLAEGVVEKYRDQRKNSLKRTFVAASDAASSKVKGRTHTKTEEGCSASKIRKLDLVPQGQNSSSEKVAENENVNIGADIFNTRISKAKAYRLSIAKRKGDEKVNMKEFVYIISSDSNHPVNILQTSAGANRCQLRFEYEKDLAGITTCKVFFNKELVTVGCGDNKKVSRDTAAELAVNKLQESCYGIKIKSKFCSDTTIDPSQLGSCSGKNSEKTTLGDDNIGRKLMMMMGWQGGGLGSKGQGIEEPLTAALQVNRDGFGQNKNDSNIEEFKKKAKDFIRTWLESESDQDLVFSTDFNTEERKAMHTIANSLALKSRSYGVAEKRQLVISRKIHAWSIVQELLQGKGNSDKYELLYPAKK